MKISLEKEDIENLIKAKYKDAEIVSGLEEEIEIVIKMKDFQMKDSVPQPSPQPEQIAKKEVTRDKNGVIDAEKSGLTLENREKTIPGSAMGQERGNLPMF